MHSNIHTLMHTHTHTHSNTHAQFHRYGSTPFFTGRNEVGPRIYFHKRVSVHGGGGCLHQCMLGYTPPGSRPIRADTPQSRHPREQIHPTEQTSWEQTPPPPEQTQPLSRPPRSRPPPPPGSRLQHTVNERPVRILLECILVKKKDDSDASGWQTFPPLSPM